jgi:AcrR family transcriptional regulator
MRSEGLARISTRDIARAAGLAEGTLYNHFRDKDEIFIAVLKRNVAEFAHVVQDLPLRVGEATVLENLRGVAEAAAFHLKVAPLFCSILADQKLLAETRARMPDRSEGKRPRPGPDHSRNHRRTMAASLPPSASPLNAGLVMVPRLRLEDARGRKGLSS